MQGFFQPQNNAISDLLKCVAFGDQEQAEELIRSNPQLLLINANVTDFSNREFSAITALQYALWSQDADMCEMILKYLSEDDATEQFENYQRNKVNYQYIDYKTQKNITKQELHFDIKPFTNLISFYDKNASSWSGNEYIRFSINEIGGAQRFIPAWLAQYYCVGFNINKIYPMERKLTLENGGVFYPLDEDSHFCLGKHFMIRSNFHNIAGPDGKPTPSNAAETANYLFLHPGNTDLKGIMTVWQHNQKKLAKMIDQIKKRDNCINTCALM